MDLILFVTRAVHIGATLLLGSFAIFGPIFLRSSEFADESRTRLSRRFMLTIRWVWLIGILSWLVWLLSTAISMTMDAFPIDPGVVREILAGTQFGHYWVVRSILWLAIGAIILTKKNGFPADRSVVSMIFLSAQLFLLAGAGHTGSTAGGYGLIRFISGGAHILAAAIWPGCLLPLCLFLNDRLNDFSEIGEAKSILGVIRRFSSASILAVSLLAITGIVNSLFVFPDVSIVLSTPYGKYLVAKAAIFLVMVGIGAFNLFKLVPALGSAAWASDWTETPRSALVRSVRRELLLGTIVILITALLGMTPPPGG
jgi:putative copper export protein